VDIGIFRVVVNTAREDVGLDVLNRIEKKFRGGKPGASISKI